MDRYTCNKSLQEWLGDITEILSSRGEMVPASQIKSEWSSYIELVIEPVGWEAIWKISRMTCEDFKIHYPTTVKVKVEKIDFDDLSALAKIIAVQDDIHLPEKYEMPLIELSAIFNQNNDALDIIGTATCLDQLRFFFNHLWMPWDIDDDENSDWVFLHLEPRIRLFFDMRRGVVDKETCDIIRTLIREGKEIKEKISRLEDSMPEEEETDSDLIDEDKACQLLKLHFRLQQIKSEMEVLENPTIREMLTRNQSLSIQEDNKDNKIVNNRKEGYFVWLGSSLEKMKDGFNKILSSLPQDFFLKTCGSLQEALLLCEVGDVIMLGEGIHEIRGSGGLEDGGAIKGIENAEYTVLSRKETESAPSLLDFSGNEVLLENISIDMREVHAGIIARKGVVKIIGCRIYSSRMSSVKLGIIVLPGAKLIVENTAFENLGTAIVIYSPGKVIVDNCSFDGCEEGIQLQDDCSLTIKNCEMEGFLVCAIRMETEKYSSIAKNPGHGYTVLENIEEISVHECSFINNDIDVFLKGKVVPIFTVEQDCTMITNS